MLVLRHALPLAVVVVLLQLLLFPLVRAIPTVVSSSSSSSVECEVDGTCHSHSIRSACGLYLAESTIPYAGYGVFTAQALHNHVRLKDYFDVAIQYVDITTQRKYQKDLYQLQLPKLLLREYFWRSSETGATFDAQHIDSIVPGFGMLANCALGLVNHEQGGCHGSPTGSFVTKSDRRDPSTGASSQYHDCYFTTSREIPAGHEMFDNYGDEWFTSRKTTFGSNVPLTDDYVKADKMVRLWQQHLQNMSTAITTNLTLDLYDMVIIKGIQHLLPKRTQQALPNTSQLAQQINYTANQTVAYHGLTNHTAVRSIEWLDENGMCLDHIVVRPISGRTNHHQQQHQHAKITTNNNERGAFARRSIRPGQMVAPAPLVHLSRRHTDMIYADMTGGVPKTVLWQGHQLLLNYCYGHPKSSLLLFPYSHGVNLINHPSNSQRANVGLRWSKRMKHPEWLQYNVSQLLEEYNDHSGLMMEFYALSDIPAGDEILYDYGFAWQQAWDKHVEVWNRTIHDTDAAVVHADNYVSAYEYEQQCNTIMSQSKESDCLMNGQVPSWISVRCWVAESDDLTKADTDVDEWWQWKAPNDAEYDKTTNEIYYYGMIDETFPCEVLNYTATETVGTKSMDYFRVRIQFDERASFDDGWNISNVPRSAIIMVDRPYTGNQHLRQAFRHEIHLPDDMVPESWKDLQTNPNSQCGLYMAESAIPFSGLGMYTGVPIEKGQKLFSGDVVVQVEDMDLNTKLRHWAAKDFKYQEKDWLLSNYYWNPDTTLGMYEAKDVQSIIPGFGKSNDCGCDDDGVNFATQDTTTDAFLQ